MNYRNNRFYRTFLSLDLLAESIDLGKSPSVSDNGAYVRHLIDHLVTPPGEAERLADEEERRRAVRLAAAMSGLERTGRGNLVPVLALIAEHGNDRATSIAKLAKMRHISKKSARKAYERARSQLLAIFDVA